MLSKKIFVAMSGGVDSAVTVAILKDLGFNVFGFYMKNWSSNFGISDKCPWQQDLEDVEKICKSLNITWQVFNFEKEYKQRILDYFFEEYKQGRTPNPDILCNNLIKFDLGWKEVKKLGADFMSTGHYARIYNNFWLENKQIWQDYFNKIEKVIDFKVNLDDINFGKTDKRNLISKKNKVSLSSGQDFGLYTALDKNKDQSYFLYRLSKQQQDIAICPLGFLLKSQVRKLAKYYNIPVADKPDSQGICFIGDIKVSDFIKDNLGNKQGDIIDKDTNQVLQKHDGLWFYTIGQRKGIKIGATKPTKFKTESESFESSGSDRKSDRFTENKGQSLPYFVVEKDSEKNIVYVAKGRQNKYLLKSEIYLKDLHFINQEDEKYCLTHNIFVISRYRAIPQKAKLVKVLDLPQVFNNDNSKIFNFENRKEFVYKLQMYKPLWAPAEGQSVIFYKSKLNRPLDKEVSGILSNSNTFINKDYLQNPRCVKILGGGIIGDIIDR